VLAALIEERHDDRDAFGFAGGGSDESLDVGVNIVRRHVVFVTANRVFQTVIQYVCYNVQVGTSHRFVDQRFGFAGTETGTGCVNQIRILGIFFKNGFAGMDVYVTIPLADNMRVDKISQSFAAGVYENTKLAHRGCRISAFDRFHK